MVNTIAKIVYRNVKMIVYTNDQIIDKSVNTALYASKLNPTGHNQTLPVVILSGALNDVANTYKNGVTVIKTAMVTMAVKNISKILSPNVILFIVLKIS